MNENKEARKKTGCLEKLQKQGKKQVIPAFGLSTWNERKLSVHLCRWNEIKMYYNN